MPVTAAVAPDGKVAQERVDNNVNCPWETEEEHVDRLVIQRALSERLSRRSNRCQRGFQFMRSAGNELLLLAVQSIN